MDNELTKYDNSKIVDVINGVQGLSDTDKKDLINRVLSDDVELRKSVIQKLSDSQIAISDLVAVQSELTALNKKGMYIKSEQTITTGSGHVKIEMKGGDAKLIIPVLVILGIIILGALIILFWR